MGSNQLGNSRRCSYCSTAYLPTKEQAGKLHDWSHWLAAWRAGFCSPACERSEAEVEYANGRAWWLRVAQSSRGGA